MRQPFVVFLGVTGALIAGVITFIQSERFADIAQRFAQHYVPEGLGFRANFKSFSLLMFPPGISLVDPTIEIEPDNVLRRPMRAKIRASRIDLVFLPFQVLSGRVRLSRVEISGGEAQVELLPASAAGLVVPPSGPKDVSSSARGRLSGMARAFRDLFRLQPALLVDEVRLQAMRVTFGMPELAIRTRFEAETFSILATSARGVPRYRLAMSLRDVAGAYPKVFSLPSEIEAIELDAEVSPLGVRMERLSLRRPSFELTAQGQVEGDLRVGRDLKADASVSASGELLALAEFLSGGAGLKLAAQELPTGRARFVGQVSGYLDRPVETIAATGKLEARELRYRGWRLDRVELEGGYKTQGVGELTLKRGVIESASTRADTTAQAVGPSADRVSHRGGRLELGQIRYRIGSSEPFDVPLVLTQVDLPWALGGLAPNLINLKARLSGRIDARVTIAGSKSEPWRLKLATAVKLEEFQFDNQRYGAKQAAVRKLFVVPSIGVDGELDVSPRALGLGGVVLSIRDTRLRASGGVDFKRGFGFVAEGPVDLAEIGSIAEIPIAGRGKVRASASGPLDAIRLDFDTELSNTRYVGLALGDLKGRVSWIDGEKRLAFSQTRLALGSSRLEVGGGIDFGAVRSTPDIRVQITQGRVSEIAGVFRSLLAGVDWFPWELAGDLQGVARVSGGLELDELRVAAQVQGRVWNYLGERLTEVSVAGGYDRGRYQIESMRASKRGGRLEGRIAYRPAQDRLEWALRSEQMSVSDLDWVARLDVPFRGELEVRSEGQGTIGRLESQTQIRTGSVWVRGSEFGPSSLSIRTEGGKLDANASVFGGQARAQVQHEFARDATGRGGRSSLELRAVGFDFSPLVMLLNPALLQDAALVGRLSGDLVLRTASGEWDRVSGRVSLNEFMLARTGSRYALVAPVGVSVRDGEFDEFVSELKADAGVARITASSQARRLRGRMDGSLDLSFVEFLTPAITQASGALELALAIGGELAAPRIEGELRARDGMLQLASLDTPLERLSGRMRLEGGILRSEDLSADLAGGRLLAKGEVEFFSDRVPRLNIRGSINDSRLKIYPFQYARVRGRAQVSGSELPYLVSGTFSIPSALIRERMMGNRGFGRARVGASPSERFLPEASSGNQIERPLLRLDIDATADRGVLVQNDLFDAELKAKLKIVNTLDAPRVLGEVRVVQGKLVFKDRSFAIQNGEVEFDNPLVLNPKFSLSASSDVSGTRVSIFAAGRLERYRVELSSTPALSESEILSLLATGFTSGDSAKAQFADRSAFEQGEAASLLLYSLDFNREVQSRTGFQIEVDEAVNNQAGVSVFRPQVDQAAQAAPKIVIKRRVGRKLQLSVGSTVGVGTTTQREVNAEYTVTPSFSFIGVWNALQSGFEAQQRTSYGLDLKVQRRFK